MKLKKKIGAYLAVLKQEKNKLVSASLCSIPLQVHPGTVRAQNDMDDAWFFYLAKHHEVIFDIGANIGFTALMAMIQNPSRSYVLVDPNPKALQKAYENLITNGLGFKAQYYSAFVSNKNDEQVTFYTIGSGQAGSMHKDHAQSAATVNSYTKVSTVTLDYLFEYYDIAPDFVKIDVEGAELLVMEGAKKLAKASQCTFLVEMHKIEELSMKAMGDTMVSWAKEQGYRVWYMKTEKVLESGEPIKSRGKCHLLLLPLAKEFPTYLKNIPQRSPLPTSL